MRRNILIIKVDDLFKFNINLALTLTDEYHRYEKLINDTLKRYMDSVSQNQDQEENSETADSNYYVAMEFGNTNNFDTFGIRDLKSNKIGKLQSFIGTITRTTQIFPELISGVFICTGCGRLSEPVEQQFKYTEPKKCLNQNCDSKHWEIDYTKSKFANFQLVRVQEDPNSIPAGGMPRSINVVLRDHNTERAQPGDNCKFTGYVCVTPDIISMLRPGERTVMSTRNAETRGNGMEMEGVKGITGMRQLSYKFMFIANNITVMNRQYHDVENTSLEPEPDIEEDYGNNEEKEKQIYSEGIIYDQIFKGKLESELSQLKQMRANPRIYEDLAQSLFSGIFGHSEIKKALLLQLFGGVHKKTTKNKISIRGDINILLVGDPSTAKSQFLKAVNKFVPRSVYTNGKTTSAAGLTASVVRDDHGNVSIEAGALMLADNGVCCIDQFDKMSLADVTAIHEAMEQQTISIAKAGVHATLNARTSVLAAANPIFGRYDKLKNLQQNLNISAPIMSRFDMCFVICDEANTQADSELCNFIVNMHRSDLETRTPRYSSKSIKHYIGVAKKLKPMLTHEAGIRLRECYISLRRSSKESGTANVATVRQLESMIRLSEALARLHLNLHVTVENVESAYELILNSITRLKKADVELAVLEEENEEKENKPVVQNVLEAQVRKKKEEGKQKVINLSEDAYNEMKRSIIGVFLLSQKAMKQNPSLNASKIELSQENIINYMVSIELEKNTIQNEEEAKNYRKIVKAVIKKMIRDERMLMVEEDSSDEKQRMLRLHPNLDHKLI